MYYSAVAGMILILRLGIPLRKAGPFFIPFFPLCIRAWPLDKLNDALGVVML